MRSIYRRCFINSGTLICILVLIPVLVPAQNVLDVLKEYDEASMFFKTIEVAGLDSELNSNGPFTIFAPTNAALKSSKERLNRASSSWSEQFVLNHVLTGMATKRQVVAMSKVPTMGELALTFSTDDDDNVVINEVTNDVSIVKSNIRAQNGVIHLIDGTLE